MKKSVLIFLLFTAAFASAQACRTSDIFTSTANGAQTRVTGAHVTVYAATDSGNVTPLATYTDSSLATTTTSVTSDSRGEYSYCLARPQTVKECYGGGSIASRCSGNITVGSGQALNVNDFPGADLGAKCQAAVNKAQSLGGGIVSIPAGTYSAVTSSCTVTKPTVSIVGAGSAATQINYTGTGKFLQIGPMSPFTIQQAGKFSGFTITGTSSGLAGVYMADVIGARLDDIVINGFTGATGVGLWWDNVTEFIERSELTRVHLDGNTKGWKQTISGSPWNSNGYNKILDMRLNVGTNQIGVSAEGPNLYNSTVNINANVGDATGTVIKFASSVAWQDDSFAITGEGPGSTMLNMGASSTITGQGLISGWSMVYTTGAGATISLRTPYFGTGTGNPGYPYVFHARESVSSGQSLSDTAAWMLPNAGTNGGFWQGFGFNLYFDGTNWATFGDGSNNGGNGIFASSQNDTLNFICIPKTAGTNQSIAHATLTASNTCATLSNAGGLAIPGGIKAGASGSKISDSRELIQSAHSCGTTGTCANTSNGSYREVFGTVALSAGAATVSSISPAFTSTSSFGCAATDQTAAAAVKAVPASTSSITLAGTGTDVIFYRCIGN